MHNVKAPLPPRVLSIAGSDSGGGAGIQADLKTFCALGVYGMTALTSVTAQNTLGVTGIHDLPAEFVARQIDAVAQDIGVDAAKTGMLSTAEIIEAVAETVARNAIPNLVIDPVMLSKSGHALLQPSAREALVRWLIPLAAVLTPNIPEAEALTGVTLDSDNAIREAARRLLAMGPRYVLIKGGHAPGPDAADHLFWEGGMQLYRAPRIDTRNTHGTGCTFSAAIAACIAKGCTVERAVAEAKRYLTEAIRQAYNLGKGHGPLNHLWNQLK